MFDNKLIVVLEGNPGSGKTVMKDNIRIKGHVIERVDQIIPNNPDSDTGLVPADIVASDLLKSSIAQKTTDKIIVIDRYVNSTLAFQYAYDRKYHTSRYGALLNIYTSLQKIGYLVKPHLTIYIDTPPPLSLSRKNRQEGTSDWTDEVFLNNMRSYYAKCADISYVVDGSGSYEMVYDKVIGIIKHEIMNYDKK